MKEKQVFKLYFFTTFLLFSSLPINAQVIPDTTLPKDTIVIQEGEVNVIDEGTRVGNNVFHSFEQFSLSPGSSAVFRNADDIQNIISRITGLFPSNIDGLIQANGAANLFLLNPNGIIFGPNAKLNIGGSFIASTARSIDFADGSEFLAQPQQTQPLLTVSVPIGLQFGTNSSTIRVQGDGHNLVNRGGFFPIIRNNSSDNIQVKPSKTLALIGGSIDVDGGIIASEGGRIELGSVREGEVSLEPRDSGWAIDYSKATILNSVQMQNRALVDVSGISSGYIQITGEDVDINSGSVILNQNQGMQAGGDILINANNSLKVEGVSPSINSASRDISSAIRAQSLGSGRVGDIKIYSKNLAVRDGGQIIVSTFSAAPGGNIIIYTSESTKIIGFSSLNSEFFSNISTATFSSGSSGNINLSTNRLSILNGGNLGAVTLSSGVGGNVSVNASDFVEVAGVEPENLISSTISAAAFNRGNAGDLTLNSPRVFVKAGGKISTLTGASGSAGNMAINSNFIEVSGTAPDSSLSSSITSRAEITSPETQTRFRLPQKPTGNAGSVRINSKFLSFNDGGTIDVRNAGLGNAGSLQITADNLNLNRGSISAATASGEGGNIFLNSQNLQLRGNSTITATAGGTGNGGNITIDTGTLTALEGSKIIADAVQGRGGNIQIRTQGLFRSPGSIFSASSQFGVDGTVDIQTLGIEPEDAIVPLATAFIPTEQAIASSCLERRNRNQGTFVVTGSGGLPESPYTGIQEFPTSSSLPLVSDSSGARSISTPEQNLVAAATAWTPGKPIVEAQAITYTPNGRVLLGMSPESAPPTPLEKLVCHQN